MSRINKIGVHEMVSPIVLIRSRMSKSYAEGYRKMRAFMHRKPIVFHVLRTLRFTFMIGPAGSLAVTYFRRVTRNATTATTATSLFTAFDPAAAASQLEADGYAPGLQLPDEHVSRLAKYFGPLTARTEYNPLRDCEAVREIAHDPKLVEVARKYLGAEPVLFSSHMWGTDATTAPGHAQRFHFDVSDYRSMTVFFYLSDVDEDSGPHAVIRGTHRRKSLRQLVQLYLSDGEAGWYGDRVQVILGSKGVGFIEEQTIYHKALPAVKPRLVLSICYTLRRQPATRI